MFTSLTMQFYKFWLNWAFTFFLYIFGKLENFFRSQSAVHKQLRSNNDVVTQDCDVITERPKCPVSDFFDIQLYSCQYRQQLQNGILYFLKFHVISPPF